MTTCKNTDEGPLGQEMALMRNLISTLYLHPNLLGHEDFSELRKFMENLGITFQCDSVEICIPAEPSGNPSMTSIHPELPSTNVPFLFSFAFISRVTFDPVKKCVIIHKYSLMPSMKVILRRLLYLLGESPEILFVPSHSFVYQFLVHFGANPDRVYNFVESKSNRKSILSSK